MCSSDLLGCAHALGANIGSRISDTSPPKNNSHRDVIVISPFAWSEVEGLCKQLEGLAYESSARHYGTILIVPALLTNEPTLTVTVQVPLARLSGNLKMI